MQNDIIVGAQKPTNIGAAHANPNDLTASATKGRKLKKYECGFDIAVTQQDITKDIA